MSNVYVYVVDRDFGFAPNPFSGMCTLATCKPVIRRVAKKDDWIIGMGGSRLKATGRCIFAMRISDLITFDEYWNNPIYHEKKPARNGSKKIIVGDNIYHQSHGIWQQIDSHHSYPDGTPNQHNVTNDTQTNVVLISDHFYYFGSAAVEIPQLILDKMSYLNGVGHRKYTFTEAESLISFLKSNYYPNILYGDPFDFELAGARYSKKDNKVTMS